VSIVRPGANAVVGTGRWTWPAGVLGHRRLVVGDHHTTATNGQTLWPGTARQGGIPSVRAVARHPGVRASCRRSRSTGIYEINWAEAIVAGLVGSFVGGMLLTIVAGDGLSLRASGLIGSIIGAIVVSAAYRWYRGRRRIA
jgi:uncharacterized membrane protein YeaQ/YmgE (transglycosylase-associated protein family)